MTRSAILLKIGAVTLSSIVPFDSGWKTRRSRPKSISISSFPSSHSALRSSRKRAPPPNPMARIGGALNPLSLPKCLVITLFPLRVVIHDPPDTHYPRVKFDFLTRGTSNSTHLHTFKLVVNRKSFGRNRKRAIQNAQFRPKVETAEIGLFWPKMSSFGRKGPLSAERAVIFWPKDQQYFGRNSAFRP